MGQGGIACPKPEKGSSRRKLLTLRLKLGKAFRDAVWARDDSKCRLCGRKVTRTLTLCAEQGHVHHIRGRRVAPEDVYNPAKALLVCGLCHHDIHAGKVPKP